MFDKRIVTIHDVAEDTMTPQRLEKIIKTSLMLGYKFVSIDEILKPATKGMRLCLTIDDAYKSTIETILPILVSYNIVATLFIPTGLLGLKANDPKLLDNDCYRDKDMMTWDDVYEWIKRGQKVGYHTHTHLDLYDPNAENNITDKMIVDDFKQGIASFTEHNISVKYFAYPKGHLPQNRDLMHKLLRNSNISHAFTVSGGRVVTTYPYYVHRISMSNKECFLLSIFKIVGFVDLLYYFVKQKAHKRISKYEYFDNQF